MTSSLVSVHIKMDQCLHNIYPSFRVEIKTRKKCFFFFFKLQDYFKDYYSLRQCNAVYCVIWNIKKKMW